MTRGIGLCTQPSSQNCTACPPCVCRVLQQSFQILEAALISADLDHSNEELRAALKEWLWWLRDSIGFQVCCPALLV